MKVTRFTQSCLLIEEGNARILIDPADEKRDFGKLDAVLYTHEHGDHFNAEICKKFIGQGVPVYANPDTAKQIGDKVNIVQNGQEFEVAGIKIKVFELSHSLLPDGSKGPQNFGYLIDEKLLHPGDGKELSGLKVNTLALPITGPDISMKDAFSFARQVGAKTVIPIHYDKIGADPVSYSGFAQRLEMPFTLKPIAVGESIELE
jgi:L-ascorbate metabolism protein UlaG (beta-lactamase superfamily)